MKKTRNFLENKKVIIMGGGTAGWTSALNFLHHSEYNNLNITVQLVASENIGTIGVGEGTTPYYNQNMERYCKISRKEFLEQTKGSLKYGIKFENWNFDEKYYYHMFSGSRCGIEEYLMSHLSIDRDLDISDQEIQRRIHGDLGFYILENGKIPFEDLETYGYSYHFSAELLIEFLKAKCLCFDNFSYQEGKIEEILYLDNGYMETLCLENDLKLHGDFFVNCLGFNSSNIIAKEYFDITFWDDYILNNSAFAIQVKNEEDEELDFYTTSSAKEYGWTWKVPQYEKTGYGYVFSDQFITDGDKLIDDIIKTYNIKPSNIIGSRLVKSKPYVNKKQIHKNCLSIGLSSGFVEPLEATSLHLTIMSLQHFYQMVHNDITSQFNFNKIMESEWNSVFEFIVYHYYTKSPINDYWKYYADIKNKNKLPFTSLLFGNEYGMFQKENYLLISLGMKHTNITHSNMFSGNELKNIKDEDIHKFISKKDNNFISQLPLQEVLTHKQLLDKIISGD